MLLIVAGLLLLPGGSTRASSPGTDYLEMLDNALYTEYSQIRLEMYKNEKLVRFYEMEFFRQKDKMRMEFTAPAAEKGRRMLNDNTSLWMYLPRTSKVMKLPFKQAFMGSDASNADLMRMTFARDYEIVRTSEKEGGMIELELKAVNPEVAYDKTVILFDPVRKVPLRQEMYSLSGKLIKTLSYEEPVQVDGQYVPSVLSIREAVQKNSLTRMIYTGIKKRNPKPAEYFTLGALKR